MTTYWVYVQQVSRIFTPVRSTVLVAASLCYVMMNSNLSRYSGQRGCSSLFHNGSYHWDGSKERGVWRPDGCRLRYRKRNESILCMSALTDKNLNAPYVVFAGDSRIRQLRDGFIFELTGQDYDVLANPNATVDKVFYRKHEAHGDFYKSAGAHVRFEWLPYLDSGDGEMTVFINRTLHSTFKPNFLILGAGIWRIRDCERAKMSQTVCAEGYKRLFLKLLPLLQQLSNTTDIIWVPQGVINEKRLRHHDDIKVGFNNANMILYNRVIQEALASAQESKITYWHSAWQTSRELNDGLDGLHFGLHTKHHLLQMILDWICHDITSAASSFPYYRRLFGTLQSQEYCCA